MATRNSNTRRAPQPRADLTGQTFGTLKVLSYAGYRKARHEWHCQCKCGRQSAVADCNLRTGRSTTCGSFPCCKRVGYTTHGRRHTPEYNVWAGMQKRCNNPSESCYQNYGGRGIRVCERWQSFENFLADMGERPSPEHTLERIDNEKGYGPDNCKWASRVEQANNKRNSRLLTFNGKTQSAAMWARELHIKSATIRARIDRLGMTVDQALGATRDCRRAT